ncbi:MAG: opacity protein-like surface antigen, partial [Zhongshania marina]
MNTKIIINAVRRVFISVSLVLLAAQAFAADFSHQTWDKLLQRHVVMIQDGQASRVDYSAFQKNQKVLQAYLASMSAVSRSEFDSWTKDQQLAFLINAYNAWTIEFVLSAYPDIKSIKDLGSFFSSPWKKEFINLLGETRSLDNIE